MVCDQTDGYVIIIILLVFFSGDLTYQVTQCADSIYIEDGIYVLHNNCQTFQTHTCINVLLFQCCIISVSIVLKLAWTMLILILPILGVVLYFVFGRSRIAAIMQQHFEQRIEESREYLRDRPQTRRKLEALDPSASNQSRYISDVSRFPVHENTTAEYFQVGDDMFPVLVRELKQAKKYIFIEYFIINDGVMWQTILNILEKKAAEGVDVRLIYDGFGCLTTLPHKYYEELQKKGIKCQVFNPFRPILNIIQNNRDHRKLCIIDGWVGFTGGINLADEYINQKARFGHWKDTAVMLKGEAVWNRIG